VRVLVRLTLRARELVSTPLTDHRRRAKKRALGIQNAKRQADRVPLYEDLIKVTDRTMSYARDAAAALDKRPCASFMEAAQVGAMASEIRHYLGLAGRVVDQTQRRVLAGESVPASDKIVSIFEAHTDIIVKDRRQTLYGHKVALTTGRSGLVIDFVVLEGNPPDSSLATTMVERQHELYGRAPRQVSFDGAFASRANLEAIKALGVGDVCFSKCRFLDVTDMVKSTWVYRKLRRFRAGIEAGVSFLKRCFGMDRCTWRSRASFRAYGWVSVLAHNLLLLARHTLG
jgi:IS5 family transposase